MIVAAFSAFALPLLYVWLAACIACSYLSNRKGYGERPGLATGLLTSALGVIAWLIVPAKAGSLWKTRGMFGTDRVAADEVEAPEDRPPIEAPKSAPDSSAGA